MFEHERTKAAFQRPGLDSGVLAVLDDAASAMGPEIAETATSAMDTLDKVPTKVIEAAIESGSAAPIVDTGVFDEYRAMLESLYGEGSIIEVGMDTAMDTVARQDFSSTLSEAGKEQSLRAYRQSARESMGQIVESSILAAERAVSNATGSGAIRAAAREMLKRKSFKLSERGAATLQRYIISLTEGDARLDMTPSQIQRAIDRRYNQLRRERAMLIAQDKAYGAASQSQTDAWRLGVLEGSLNPDLYEQEWIARILGACPLCRALDGVRAPLPGGIFVSRPIATGARAGQIIRFSAPLVHPRCYCGRRLVGKE